MPPSMTNARQHADRPDAAGAIDDDRAGERTEDLDSAPDAGSSAAGVDTDELPGINPDEQPGIPDDPMGPAEGGD